MLRAPLTICLLVVAGCEAGPLRADPPQPMPPISNYRSRQIGPPTTPDPPAATAIEKAAVRSQERLAEEEAAERRIQDLIEAAVEARRQMFEARARPVTYLTDPITGEKVPKDPAFDCPGMPGPAPRPLVFPEVVPSGK